MSAYIFLFVFSAIIIVTTRVCIVKPSNSISLSKKRGASVAQWVERWPADLSVTGSILAGGGNLYNRLQGSIAYSLSLSPSHRPDMTERQ